ncbi:MAG TPA: hypothetical protein VGE52_04830 [Pirellulales bacterium]
MSAVGEKPVEWSPQPAGARWVTDFVERMLSGHAFAARLAHRMLEETGTRFRDWLDHVALPESDPAVATLMEAGYTATFGRNPAVSETAAESRAEARLFRHPTGLFPPVLVGNVSRPVAALKVDSVADFLAAHDPHSLYTIAGDPLTVYRAAEIPGEGCDLRIVERRDLHAFSPAPSNGWQASLVLKHQEAFQRRRRRFANDVEGFDLARTLFDDAAADLGPDRAVEMFFARERSYWQSRNRAAQVQKARQDALGLGWGNHDHHTYRSSREGFSHLIGLLVHMGFSLRERFYAGRDAGWGAQVLEHPGTNVVIFADVDLSPEEVVGDFATNPLPPREKLGTVGLWCALHGEAFLQAGMHHLECQFDYHAATAQLERAGVKTMPPFTNFPYLKQCFTQGEIWPVSPERLEVAVAAGRLTPAQAAKFREQGAVGSHLEILQRDDGYKGFNQTGINDIIARTDPRTLAGAN